MLLQSNFRVYMGNGSYRYISVPWDEENTHYVSDDVLAYQPNIMNQYGIDKYANNSVDCYDTYEEEIDLFSSDFEDWNDEFDEEEAEIESLCLAQY